MSEATTTEVLKHGAKYIYKSPNSGYNDKGETHELYVSFTTETDDVDAISTGASAAFAIAKATVFEQAGVPFSVETNAEGAVSIKPQFPATPAPAPKGGGFKPAGGGGFNGGASKFGSAPKPFGGGGGGNNNFSPTPPNPTKQDIGDGFTLQQSQKSGKWYLTHPEATRPDPRKGGKPGSVLCFLDGDPNGLTPAIAAELMAAEMAKQ
jgi:hypothetical protein